MVITGLLIIKYLSPTSVQKQLSSGIFTHKESKYHADKASAITFV